MGTLISLLNFSHANKQHMYFHPSHHPQSFFSKHQFVVECLIYFKGKYLSYLCFLQNHDLLQNHHPEQDPYLQDLCKRNIPFHYATNIYIKHSAEVSNQDSISHNHNLTNSAIHINILSNTLKIKK